MTVGPARTQLEMETILSNMEINAVLDRALRRHGHHPRTIVEQVIRYNNSIGIDIPDLGVDIGVDVDLGYTGPDGARREPGWQPSGRYRIHRSGVRPVSVGLGERCWMAARRARGTWNRQVRMAGPLPHDATVVHVKDAWWPETVQINAVGRHLHDIVAHDDFMVEGLTVTACEVDAERGRASIAITEIMVPLSRR